MNRDDLITKGLSKQIRRELYEAPFFFVEDDSTSLDPTNDYSLSLAPPHRVRPDRRDGRDHHSADNAPPFVSTRFE